MEIKPRDYQEEFVSDIRNALVSDRCVLGVLPTGGGKSVCLSMIALSSAKKGNITVIGVHRDSILRQNFDAATRMGVKCQIINAQTKKIDDSATCYVAMVQTLSRRLKKSQPTRKLFSKTKLFVLDEAARGEFDSIWDYIPKTSFVVGLTATAQRRGNARCLGEFYSKIIQGPTPQELVSMGYIVAPEAYTCTAPSLDGAEYSHSTGDWSHNSLSKIFRNKERYSGVVSNFSRLIPDKKTLVFTTGKLHAAELTHQFCLAGFNAKYLVSDGVVENYEKYTDSRDKIINGFLNNEFQILVSIGTLDVGFSDSTVEAVIADVATCSWTKWEQLKGRGCRKHKGKNKYYLLDHGGNIQRHNISEYGVMPEPSLWHNSSQSGICPTKECPQDRGGCSRLVPLQTKSCPWCQYIWPTKSELVEIELQQYIPEDGTETIESWIAKEIIKNQEKPRKNFNNWILMQIVAKNSDRKYEAFCQAIEVLRKKNGSNISKKYFSYFMKHIYHKNKHK